MGTDVKLLITRGTSVKLVSVYPALNWVALLIAEPRCNHIVSFTVRRLGCGSSVHSHVPLYILFTKGVNVY
jgi:hypothetical protein